MGRCSSRPAITGCRWPRRCICARAAAWCHSARPPSALTRQVYVFGCQVAEVEVDTVTGEVQVLGVWAVHDVGRAVNPRGVEGQIEGGIVQALGQGLMEDYRQENGRTSTPGFAKYILPTALDVP